MPSSFQLPDLTEDPALLGASSPARVHPRASYRSAAAASTGA
ncbi:hypothetical protein AHiyo8_07910 [Arthrobacter sp. Hiyo8]|nr:hypothetical protein AHiyo8_07910 [Arthrobacter sp. Hiyo8]